MQASISGTALFLVAPTAWTLYLRNAIQISKWEWVNWNAFGMICDNGHWGNVIIFRRKKKKTVLCWFSFESWPIYLSWLRKLVNAKAAAKKDSALSAFVVVGSLPSKTCIGSLSSYVGCWYSINVYCDWLHCRESDELLPSLLQKKIHVVINYGPLLTQLLKIDRLFVCTTSV